MKINQTTKLSEIKTSFSETYPGLKIEFYSQKHKDHTGSQVDDQLNEDQIVSYLNPNLIEGVISIEETRSVSDVEKDFEDKFGLHVQVFRRSNDLWLQTVSTDHWDLKTQNGKGIRSIQNQKI